MLQFNYITYLYVQIYIHMYILPRCIITLLPIINPLWLKIINIRESIYIYDSGHIT